MRTLTDAAGQHWDVAIGEESYGTLRLIFAERMGGGLRSHELALHSRLEAEQFLLGLTEESLRALLAGAVEWRPG